MKIEKTIIVRISNSHEELDASPRDRQHQEGVGVSEIIRRTIRSGYYIFGLIHLIVAYHENLTEQVANILSRLI
ncbi:hypothetical protein [Halomonas elongata]|uniref:hypothetical protein n=1 Tax=Halomonas elongata TaxID=2746 RepID=UPI0023B12D0C|nr:hypothetical protein [Halomonas elongata]